MSSPSLSADAVQTQSTPAPAPAGTTTTTIAYDMAGRHLREKVVRTNQAFEDNPSLKGTEVFQDNHLSYDTLGRLTSSADNSTQINFDYDKAGNRTRVGIASFLPGVNHPDSETPTHVSRYFLYDAMNRQTVVDGLNADGDISSAQGHKLTYDLNGNRRTDVFYGNHVTGTLTVYDHDNVSGGTVYHAGSLGHTTALVTETYVYDGLDRLQKTTRDGIEVDSRFYDEASRLLQSGPTGLPTDYGEEVNEGVAPEEQTGTEIRRMRYDVDGRLLFERARKSDDSTGTYDVDYEGTSGHDHRQLGYDGVGNAIAYDTTIYDGGIDYLANVSLARFEGYVQKSETHTDLHGDQTGTTSSRYDANGLLVSLDDSTEDSLDRGFVNDADGHILRTRQGGNDLWSTVVSGEVLGRHGVGMDPADERTDHGAANLAQVSDFGFGYRHISGSYPKAGVGSYTIRQGDSLQSVAQAAFGDSKLWWKVAEANGVSGNTDLKVGQTLKLPNLVEGQSNDSGTFKPYDPSDAVGDTSPNLPMPHHGEACGGFGQIIMIVVAVAVTVYTAGVLSETAAAGIAETFSAGATALEGGTLSLAEVAVAGAAGSIASQAVGNAIGAQDGFSWEQVALSSVSAGATQGAGQILANTGLAANVAARAALANALTQGVGLATGLEDRFEWKAVAASAAGAQVGRAVNTELGPELQQAFDSSTAAKLVTGTAAGIVSGASVSLMRGGRVSVTQIATDAFGQALSSSIVDEISTPESPAPHGLTLEPGTSERWGPQPRVDDVPMPTDYALASAGGARLGGNVSEDFSGGEDFVADVRQRRGEMARQQAAMLATSSSPQFFDVERGVSSMPIAYVRPDGLPVYQGTTGIQNIGAISATRFALDDLPPRYQSEYGAVRLARDAIGQGYLAVPVDSEGATRFYSPPAGYDVPSLAALQARQMGRGVVAGVTAAPGAASDVFEAAVDFMDGAFNPNAQAQSPITLGIRDGRITAGSLLYGLVESSPAAAAINVGIGTPESLYAAGETLGSGAVFGAAGLAAGSAIRLSGPFGELVRNTTLPIEANALRLSELISQGHALERHGGGVSDADLIRRAYTGVAPDGSVLPRGRTPDSTAFYDDNRLVQADDFLRQNALPDAIANAAPGQLRLGVSGDMGAPIGRGYLPVGKVTGLSGPLLRVDSLTNVQGWYVYNPTTSAWETNTIFPLARP